MKLIIVLAVIGTAIADIIDVTGDTEVTTNVEDDGAATVSSLERQPTRPVFPKSVETVILSTKSSTVTNGTTPVNRSHKKPMFKIVQKAVKMKSKSHWKTSTRRPSLMKHTKFTIDPLTTYNKYRPINHKQSDRELRRKYKINQFRKTMSSNKDDSSEEESETTTATQKHKIKHVKSLIRRFHKLHSKVNEEINAENISKFNDRINKNRHTDATVKPRSGEISSEENEDRQEFIFVTPKIIQEHTVKVEEDSDESGESTTMMFEGEIKTRQKRSINVIEEENLGTTVSGFKFTGKVSSLSSNLVFRNINT